MLIANRANCTLAYFRRRVASRLRKLIIPVSSEPVMSHLEYHVWLWAPQVKKMLRNGKGR